MNDDANHPPLGDDDHPNHFLREWREFMGWSQEELADMVSVQQTKISRVENGKRDLKMGFLRDLARIFGVPASALLEVNPATDDGKQTATLLLTWNKLTKSQRADVLKMVRALAPPDDKANGA